jgi:UDP-GlcNAc:undecaprenyl-phosphate/decaprenyl-phosphate GlcNAc-1-phosphate transferase
MSPTLLLYFFFFLGSFILAFALTPLVRKIAFATGQTAVPKDTRWHKKETALLGGVAICLSSLSVWFFTVGLFGWQAFGVPYLPVICCAFGMFLLGLADDIISMAPQHKLAAQLIISSIVVFFGFRLNWTTSMTMNLFFSMIWVVGITNAFNLLDNMDGLSAGIAFIAGAFVFLTHFLKPETSNAAGFVLITSSIYLGSVLGFLVYNFNPASIFMGDAGSLFIGFMIACLTMISGGNQVGMGGVRHLLSIIAIPIFIVFVPILDTGFVSLMRKLFRRPISQGGKDHASHRMVAIGLSERKAVIILYGFAFASGIIALSLNYLSFGMTAVLIVFYLLFVAFFWVYLGRVKVYPGESILSQGASHALTPILVEITYKRRLFEVFLDFVLISVAYYTSYLLRFEGHINGNFDFFLRSLPIVLASQVLAFYMLGVYRGVWERTSVRDLIGYLKAITAGTILSILIILFIYRFQSFSRAVFVIYWGLMVILVSLSRLSFRLLDEGIRLRSLTGEKTLIYGAGIGGQLTLREIENNHALGLELVGFLDDNPRLHGRNIQGYPVFGGESSLEAIIRRHSIRKIIVSFKAKGEEKAKDIEALCANLGEKVEVKQMRILIS